MLAFLSIVVYSVLILKAFMPAELTEDSYTKPAPNLPTMNYIGDSNIAVAKQIIRRSPGRHVIVSDNITKPITTKMEESLW